MPKTIEDKITYAKLMTRIIKYGVVRANWKMDEDMTELDNAEIEVREGLKELLSNQKATFKRAVEGMIKNREEHIKTSTETKIVEHHRTYKLALTDILKKFDEL